MPRLSRCFAVLLLVLLFLPVVLRAAEPRRDAEPLRSGPSVRISWDVLAQVWSFLTSVTSDNGCRLDPSGLCLPGKSAVVTADNGCLIEPNGRCRD